MASDDRALVLGVVIATLAVGGLFILARVITRTLIKPAYGWDDSFMIITWFIILGYAVCMFVSVGRGYGRHMAELTPQQLVQAQEAEVIGQFFAIFSFPTGKAAVAYLLKRLFPGRTLKIFLWTLVAANAAFFYIDGILILAQCSPVAYQWDRSIPGGTCWDSSIVIDWGYLTGVTGAVTDLLFAALPWYYIVRLQIPLREKISIGIALSMGFFPFVCSIMKIYNTSALGAHADFTFDTVPLVLWSSAELCAINIAACVPTLRPLYLWMRGKNPSGTTSKTPGYGASKSRHVMSFQPFRRVSRGTQLGSIDTYDNYIHELRTYEVSSEARAEEQMRHAQSKTTISAATATNTL